MKRPGGRPRDPESAGKTQQINVRVSLETRRMLEEAADEDGVTLSREIERRLARSFEDGAAAGQAISNETAALLWAIKNCIIRVEEGAGTRWHRDTFTCRAVGEATMKLLLELEPEGDGKPPPRFPTHVPAEFEDMRHAFAEKYAEAGFGTVCAAQFLELLARDAPTDERRRRQFNATFPAERAGGNQVLRQLLRHPQPQVALRASAPFSEGEGE